jgi:hypothetical protein
MVCHSIETKLANYWCDFRARRGIFERNAMTKIEFIYWKLKWDDGSIFDAILNWYALEDIPEVVQRMRK